MKKLLIILFSLITVAGFSQVTPFNRGSSSILARDARVQGYYNLVMPVGSDTTLYGGLDSLGSLIFNKLTRTVYFRDTIDGGHVWTAFGSGGGGGNQGLQDVIDVNHVTNRDNLITMPDFGIDWVSGDTTLAGAYSNLHIFPDGTWNLTRSDASHYGRIVTTPVSASISNQNSIDRVTWSIDGTNDAILPKVLLTGIPTGAGYVLTDVPGNGTLSLEPPSGGGGGTQSWDSTMRVSPDLLQDYGSNFHNKSWAIDSINSLQFDAYSFGGENFRSQYFQPGYEVRYNLYNENTANLITSLLLDKSSLVGALYDSTNGIETNSITLSAVDSSIYLKTLSNKIKMDLDSVGSPINSLWQDSDGFIHKGAAGSGTIPTWEQTLVQQGATPFAASHTVNLASNLLNLTTTGLSGGALAILDVAGRTVVGIGDMGLSANQSRVVVTDQDSLIELRAKHIIATLDSVNTPQNIVWKDNRDSLHIAALPASSGVLSLSAIGATPNANAATITGTVLNLQPASASFGGVVTTGTQTFAGNKAFTNLVTFATGTTSLAPFNTPAGVLTTGGNIVNGNWEFNGTHAYITIAGVQTQLDNQTTGANAPWLLLSGGALTGINNITNTTLAGLNWHNVATFTANNQFLEGSSGTATARATASDVFTAHKIYDTLVWAANAQEGILLDLAPTFTVGGFTTPNQTAIQSKGNINPAGTGVWSMGRTANMWAGVYANSWFGTTWNANGANNQFINNNSNKVVTIIAATQNMKLGSGTTTTDSLYKLDVNGDLKASGGIVIAQLPTPVITSVANQGVAGATTYTYKLVYRDQAGNVSGASAAVSTTTGNTTLSGSNFNRISFSGTEIASLTSYYHDIYRTVGGATQGKIATVSGYGVTIYDDIGGAGDATTAPINNNSGNIGVGILRPTAGVDIRGGVADVSGGQIKFRNSAALTTTPEIGGMSFKDGLWYIDSSNSVRDTIAGRAWARANITGGSGGGTTLNGTGYVKMSGTSVSYVSPITYADLNLSNSIVNGDLTVGAVTDDKASLLVKPAVALVATSNLTLSGEQTIDGTLTAGSRVLLTGQTTGSENGFWVTAAGAWSRPTFYTNGSTTQAPQFLTTFVRLGTTYQGTTWRMTTAAVTIGTTVTAWVETPLVLNSTSVTGILPSANGGSGINNAGTLTWGAGGTLGTNAFTSTAYAPLASPTFTGTVTIPTPFTLGATSVTSTGTQLNYLNAATGTTGTTSTNLVFSTSPTLTTPVINGLATGTGVASAATASTLMTRDANANASVNNTNFGYTTTATAAGTTTLTVGSTLLQYFTGSTTQTVVLPVASTLVLGQRFIIANNSTGLVTVQSSGANSIVVIPASGSATLTCILTSGTTAASWASNVSSSIYIDAGWQTYTGDTWDGTAPTTSVSRQYRWIQDGKKVQLWITLNYSGAGVTNTNLDLAWPADVPLPQEPAGRTATNDVEYIGTGRMAISTSSATANVKAAFIIKTGTLTYKGNVSSAAVSAKTADYYVTYPTP